MASFAKMTEAVKAVAEESGHTVISDQHSVLAMVTGMEVMRNPAVHIPSESVIGRAFVAAFVRKWLDMTGFAHVHTPMSAEEIVRNTTNISSEIVKQALPKNHKSTENTLDVLRATMMVQMCGSKDPLLNFGEALCEGPPQMVRNMPSRVLTQLETVLKLRGPTVLFDCLREMPTANSNAGSGDDES